MIGIVKRILRRHAPSSERAPDGLPMPPQDLRFLVSGVPDYTASDFLEMGRLCATRIEETLRIHGVDISRLEAVLDFGCGCGRTLRHFVHLKSTRLHGTDYNRELVRWCRRNLPFAQFGVNRLEPPLAHAGRTFDLIYAFSVLTHLPEQLQHRWLDEFTRLLKPGGFLALSTMPGHWLAEENEEGRRRFQDGQLVVVNAAEAGSNSCLVYHPEAYTRDMLAPRFEILDYVPGGVGQDFWLLRNRPAHSRDKLGDPAPARAGVR